MVGIFKNQGILLTKAGFVKVVETSLATLDTSSLPAGYAFKIEFRTQKTDGFQPVIDTIKATFR